MWLLTVFSTLLRIDPPTTNLRNSPWYFDITRFEPHHIFLHTIWPIWHNFMPGVVAFFSYQVKYPDQSKNCPQRLWSLKLKRCVSDFWGWLPQPDAQCALEPICLTPLPSTKASYLPLLFKMNSILITIISSSITISLVKSLICVSVTQLKAFKQLLYCKY